MNLIVDISHTAHACWMYTNTDIKKWKKSILTSILSYVNKFQPEKTIIAADNISWRKQYYEFYKCRKVLSPEKKFFKEQLSIFIEELKQNSSFYVISTELCEADDIISTLCRNINTSWVIISKDKDFNQLLKYPNIKIWNPQKKDYVNIEEPEKFLYFQILQGDSVDDVPNFLSDNDTFNNKSKKQYSLRLKTIEKLWELTKSVDQVFDIYSATFNQLEKEVKLNIERNKTLINLHYTPRGLQQKILTQLQTYEPSSKEKWVSYLMTLDLYM